jgi:hypothetical protein
MLSSEECAKLWSQAKTFDQVRLVNMRFVQGELPWSPYHNTPLLADSQPLVTSLLHLHEHGLITVNGQSGTIEEIEWIKAWSRTHDDGTVVQGGNRFVQSRQKAFVNFIMEKTASNRALLDRLMVDPALVWVVADEQNDEVKATNALEEPYWVTDEREGKTAAQCSKATWEGYSTLGVSPAHNDFEVLRDTAVWSMCVAFREWATPGLEEHILHHIHVLEDDSLRVGIDLSFIA